MSPQTERAVVYTGAGVIGVSYVMVAIFAANSLPAWAAVLVVVGVVTLPVAALALGYWLNARFKR